jgi:DNA-binding PadR family transcriptional regulator
MARINDTACTILGFLHDRPMAGWDLSEAVQATIGFFWNVTRSQIYRELRTLEAEGLVIGGERGVREKRAYTITDAGREVFAEWITREPGPETARYPLLVTVWFSDHLGEEQFDWFLRFHRAQHERRLRFYRDLSQGMQDQSTPAARALRFGLFYEEAVVGWFDSLPNFGGVEPTSESAEEPRPAEPARLEDFGPAASAGPEGEDAPPPAAGKPGGKRTR